MPSPYAVMGDVKAHLPTTNGDHGNQDPQKRERHARLRKIAQHLDHAETFFMIPTILDPGDDIGMGVAIARFLLRAGRQAILKYIERQERKQTQTADTST